MRIPACIWLCLEDRTRLERLVADGERNGTTTLFAALNVLDGKVIGQCMKRHRPQEFIRFLNRIDRQTLPYLDIHPIIDNHAARKTPEVKRWLKKHSRFHIHVTPTSASWLNMIERFFAGITRKRIRRGAFKSRARQTNTRNRQSGNQVLESEH